ncbi:MAG: hypothetical protein NC394_00775 [Bacteroides sp.]|nr:hypothetical protein [Bacteroides sp.]
MMKVEIVLDEDKIRDEGEYEVSEIRRCTCIPFESPYLRRLKTDDNSIVYCGTGSNHDYTHLWRANVSLVEDDWFVHYVKKWIWEDEDGQEDILDGFSKNKVGAYA